MNLKYKNFTVISNRRFTHYISKERLEGDTLFSNQNSIYLYNNESESVSFKLNKNELNLIMNRFSTNNTEEIFNDVKKFLNENSKIIDDKDLININKYINEKIKSIISYNEFIATSIEFIDLNKISYLNSDKKNIKDQYYIFGYSLYKEDSVLRSDFKILDKLNKLTIDSIVNLLISEINWTRKKKYRVKEDDKRKVVLKNTAAGIFFHECIGHFLEADYYKVSPIRLLKNKKLFPNNVNTYENYNVNFDKDEFSNNISKNIQIIKEGYISNILNNNKYSKLFLNNSTGNNSIELIDIYSSPRMRSMFVEPEDNNLDDLIENIDKGIFIENISLGEVDVFSGEFSVLVDKSYKIINGYLTDPIEEFRLNYNIKDLVKMNIKLCNDLNEECNLCGKSGNIVKVKYCTPSMLLESQV